MVGRISADVTADQRTGQSYYTIRITIDAAEAARLGNVKLIPGMPVETFMKTYDRTVFSYFTKPLQDQGPARISRAVSEVIACDVAGPDTGPKVNKSTRPERGSFSHVNGVAGHRDLPLGKGQGHTQFLRADTPEESRGNI